MFSFVLCVNFSSISLLRPKYFPMAYKNLHSSWSNFKLYCLTLSKTSRRRASVSQYVLLCITLLCITTLCNLYIVKETKSSRESLVLCMRKIDTNCLELSYEFSLIKRSNTESCHYFTFVNRKVVWIDEKGRMVGWTRKGVYRRGVYFHGGIV